ncbi:MAG: glycosyltransferase family 4 protein [Parachlamydiales bacterium]|nr:glycosyltransferase family 4 protein [Parachlamydiales bacterium]
MDKKLNILHLESSPGWGGQEIRTLKESLGFIKRGHKVFIAVEKNGGLYKKASQAKIKAYEIRFKKAFWFLGIFKLIWIIKKHKINLINTHSSSDSWLGGILAKIFHLPVIRTRHLSTPIKKGVNSKLLYGFLADYVVTTSKQAADIVISQTNKDIASCKSIPTGLDIENIKNIETHQIEKFKNDFNLSKTDFLVGTACFMRSWKGIDDLLQAAKLLEDEKDIKILIIGGGHKEKYIQMAKDLNLKNVIFTDHLEDPLTAIAALDVFTLLSTAHEGVSQASLQAAFLKKPLIATPTGGLKEICVDNVTGIQVPIFSPEKVKNAILKIKNEEMLKNNFSKNAHELSLKFSIKSMLDQMQEVYNQLFFSK